ncbi:MAG: glycosyltransferase 87 family protein [Gaiellaceae bacterium]
MVLPLRGLRRARPGGRPGRRPRARSDPGRGAHEAGLLRSRILYAALGVFLVSFSLLYVGFYRHKLIRDTVEYYRFGTAMLDGALPYRDFKVEYPPGALPLFALPALGRPGFNRFQWEFQVLVGLLAGGAMVAMASVLDSLRASTRRYSAALFFFALAPLALGSVLIYRYDIWPTALAVAGLAAILARRERLGLVALGVGFAAKIFPGVIVPPALAYVWRTRGRREALVCLGAAALAVAVIVVPFAALAPHGLWSSVHGQAGRPLQIESLGSSILLAAHQAGGLHLNVITSHGSQNLAGSLPDSLALAQTLLLATVLLGAWVAFALGPPDPERLVRYAAACVTAFVVFDKVLSPQFMIWLLPLVPLVRGRRGLVASALLGLALILTQLWFPTRYFDLARGLAAFPSWLVLARDLTLLVLLTTLLVPGRAAPRS